MKKLLSLLLVISVVFLCFGSVSLVAFANDTVTIDDVTYITISSATEFSSKISNEPSGKFALISDITLDQANGAYTPIESFSGTLVGADASGEDLETRTITVNYNGAATATTAGVFKTIGGTVKNIKLTGDFVVTDATATCHIGGLAADVADSISITDCESNIAFDITTGKTTYVGGLLGYLGSAKNVIFTNCKSTGSFTTNSAPSTYYVGGLYGYHYGNTTATFINCHNSAEISGKFQQVGGLLGGVARKEASFTNCSNTASLTGGKYVGGLLGSIHAHASYSRNVIIKNCFNSGAIVSASGIAAGLTAGSAKEASATGADTITISDSFNFGTVSTTSGTSAGIAVNNPGNYASADNQLTITRCYDASKNANFSLSTDAMSLTNCYYLADNTGAETNGLTPLSDTDMKDYNKFEGFDFSSAWVMTSSNNDNSKYYLYPQLTGNLYYPETPETPVEPEPEPEPEPELGTEENPYKITTAEEFTSLINANKGAGKYFRLEENISLGDKDAEVSYSPIEFIGNFDGNGKTITIYINGDNLLTYGLFSTVTDSTIKDLTVAGEINVIQSVENPGSKDNIFVGAIASLTDKTTITNCINNADINASGDRIYSGGIVGRRSTSSLTISKCTNNGDIASYYAGGIAGFLDAGTTTIDECINYGKISGNYIGGLAGRAKNATVKNSYNYGAVNGTAITGGIIGEVNTKFTVNNTYNYGTVQSVGNYPGKVGGIVGANTSTGAILIFDNVYNLGAVIFEGEYVNQQILGSDVALNDGSSLANVSYLAYDESYDDERENTALKTKADFSNLDLSKLYLVTNSAADNGIYSSENKNFYAYENSIINYIADGDEDYTVIEANVNGVPVTVNEGAFSFVVSEDTIVSIIFTIPQIGVTAPVKFALDTVSLSDSILTEEAKAEIADATKGALFFSKFAVRESDLEYGFVFSKDNVIDENDTLKAASKPEAVAVFYGNNDTKSYYMASYIKDKNGEFTFFNINEFALNVDFVE